MLKKLLAVVLAMAMLLSMLTVTASAAEEDANFSDTASVSWAEDSIDRWADYGVVTGYSDGTFKPLNTMTRAQYAVTMDRLLGLSAQSPEGTFSDLTADWYKGPFLRAHAAGIINGTGGGKASPTNQVTREMAFVMLGRALGIQGEPADTAAEELEGFHDDEQVHDWARPVVAALVKGGYVSGTGAGKLNPQNPINRASVMSLLDKTITTYVNEPGEVEAEAGGFTVINTDGEVTLTGETDGIIVAAGSENVDLTISEATVNGDVQINAEGAGVTVEGSEINGDVNLNADDNSVALTDTAVNGDVNVDGSDAEVSLENSKVENVDLSENADGATVDVGAGSSVETVTTAAGDATVTGDGEVKAVEVTDGNVAVETKGTEVSVSEDAPEDAKATVGDTEVKAGDEPATTDGEPEPYVEPSEEPTPAPTKKYTVTFDLNVKSDGTTPTAQNLTDANVTAPASQSLAKNRTVTAPDAITLLGWKVAGWYADADLTTAWDFDNDTVSEAVTLYAKWEKVATVTITFDVNGGDAMSSSTMVVNKGEVTDASTLPTPTRTGYTFKFWTGTKDDDTDKVIDGNIFTTDETLYAFWEVAAQPTAEPTAQPTAEPTAEPTAQPTAEPTKATKLGTVAPANLFDVSGTVSSGADVAAQKANLIDASSYKATTDNTPDSDNVITVTVSGTNLKYHENAESGWGYWTGFSITPPAGEDVDGVKAVVSLKGPKAEGATIDSAFTALSAPAALTEKVNEAQDASGFAQYLDISDAAYKDYVGDGKPGVWAKVQWFKGSEAVDVPVYYNIKFNITTAPVTKYDVKFLLNDGADTEYTAANASIVSGQTVAKPATDPTRAGYTFVAWYDNETKAAASFPYTVSNAATFYAVWKPATDATKLGTVAPANLFDNDPSTTQTADGNGLHPGLGTGSIAAGNNTITNGVISYTINYANLVSHKNKDGDAGLWGGISITAPTSDNIDGYIASVSLVHGTGLEKGFAAAAASPAALEINVDPTVSKPGFTQYLNLSDAAYSNYVGDGKPGVWIKLQWTANNTPVDQPVYYNVKFTYTAATPAVAP